MKARLALVFAVLIAPLVSGGCDRAAASDPPETAAPALEIETDAAAAAIADGALVLDVRTSGEFDQGSIEGAHLIPHDEVAARIAEIEGLAGDRNRTIVTYCRSGGRAQKAKDALENAGFSAVINGGGYEALSAALED